MIIEINENLLKTFKNAFSYRFFETQDNSAIENLLVEELRKNCFEGFTLDGLTQIESIYKFKKDAFMVLNSQEFFIFNIKNTKRLTDYYGYQYSDNLIKEVALTLKANIPQNVIYRIAGDKFFSFGGFEGKFVISEPIQIESSHVEAKPEFKTRRGLFQHPETILDFILEVSYEMENEFFKVKNRYILP